MIFKHRCHVGCSLASTNAPKQQMSRSKETTGGTRPRRCLRSTLSLSTKFALKRFCWHLISFYTCNPFAKIRISNLTWPIREMTVLFWVIVKDSKTCPEIFVAVSISWVSIGCQSISNISWRLRYSLKTQREHDKQFHEIQSYEFNKFPWF